ncbi:probable serine/threonine-protein kinase pats1 [Lingula anatina]|uniref:Probable serine/threonine-protein kinase pats1 n=1 Tax=Lingula anatina TaxID=7574 RepID=A0A1S3I6D7_LINAN|nr:probable serine/threonine-protein kinase pats1 [Lingula anatina]|eukprot:XP_013393768.1 probable serine/threonine-protein kinase pats1 [Lingula anatina]
MGEEFTEEDLVTNGIEVSGCVLVKHTAGSTFKRQDESFREKYYIETLARGIKECRGKRPIPESSRGYIVLDEGVEFNTFRQIFDKSKGEPVVPDTLTLWDFGGQYVFYTTHQTFLTWRAVYLLVFDLTKDLNDPVHVERVGRTGRRPVDSVPDTVGGAL